MEICFYEYNSTKLRNSGLIKKYPADENYYLRIVNLNSSVTDFPGIKNPA